MSTLTDKTPAWEAAAAAKQWIAETDAVLESFVVGQPYLRYDKVLPTIRAKATTALAAAFAAGQQAERERCIGIAEAHIEPEPFNIIDTGQIWRAAQARAIVAALRATGGGTP